MDTQVRLVRHFKYTFSIFKQHYIHFHTFFFTHTRISKNYKQYYSNFSTKRILNLGAKKSHTIGLEQEVG